jgi:hypothetical protein
MEAPKAVAPFAILESNKLTSEAKRGLRIRSSYAIAAAQSLGYHANSAWLSFAVVGTGVLFGVFTYASPVDYTSCQNFRPPFHLCARPSFQTCIAMVLT